MLIIRKALEEIENAVKIKEITPNGIFVDIKVCARNIKKLCDYENFVVNSVRLKHLNASKSK